jgi:2Fe-2S ferredoxin
MPKITYISHAGTPTTLDVASGMSVMRAAVMNAVPGIDAECGGSCACATCHVIVDPAWTDRLPAPSTMELDTLDLVSDPQPNSRLSCQLTLTDALDGLVVHTPLRQG